MQDGFSNDQWRAFLEQGVVPAAGGNVDLNAVRQTYTSLEIRAGGQSLIVDKDEFLRALVAVYRQHDTTNIRMNVGTLCNWWLLRGVVSPAPSGAQLAYLRWLVLSDPVTAGGTLLQTVLGRGKLKPRDVKHLRWILATQMGSPRSLADRDVDNNSGPALDVSMAAAREKRRRFIHALNNLNESCRQGWLIQPEVEADGTLSYGDLDEPLTLVKAQLEALKVRMQDYDDKGVLWKGMFDQAKRLYERQKALEMESEQRTRRLRVHEVARAAVRDDPYFDDGFVVPATLHPHKVWNGDMRAAWRVNAREAKKDIAVMSLEATFGKPYATREEQQEAVRAIKRSKLTDAIVTGTYHSYYSVDESATPVDPKDNGARIPTSFGGSVLNKF